MEMTKAGTVRLRAPGGGRKPGSGKSSQDGEARALAIMERWAQGKPQESAEFRRWRAQERQPATRAERRFACYLRDARNATVRILGGTPDDDEQPLPANGQLARTARKEEERSIAARYVRGLAAIRNAVKAFEREGVPVPYSASVDLQHAQKALEEAFVANRFTAHI